jgi:hypothetical protein
MLKTTKQTVIKAGYRISVHTWENDWDNHNTEILDGVTKEHVPFIVAICKLFTSWDKGFGNIYDDDDKEKEMNEALEKVIGNFTERPKYCDTVNNLYDSLLYYLGITRSSDYCTRVVETIKIEFIPQDIYINDVTDQFV